MWSRRTLSCIALLEVLSSTPTHGWTAQPASLSRPTASLFARSSTLLYQSSAETSSSAVEEPTVETTVVEESSSSSSSSSSLTQDIISKLRFRELRHALEQRHLPTDGTTAQLRARLKASEGLQDDADICVVESANGQECLDVSSLKKVNVAFIDESDPNFEANELVREIEAKAAKGHWKAATRKLKRLARRHPETNITPDLLEAVLEACMAGRLQGARASEPARKILEQMAERGYDISTQAGNYCIRNSLGDDNDSTESTHQGFGGLDTALAMRSALELAGTPLQWETQDKLCQALAKAHCVDDALSTLRTLVMAGHEEQPPPPLATLAAVATAAVRHQPKSRDDDVMTILSWVKATGFELDAIGASPEGRQVLAAGVVAAQNMGNVALGLRLLTAAATATKPSEGEADIPPEARGDALLAKSSPAAQRACTLLHKTAINRAVEDSQWKLAVRLLELMLERGLKPSPYIWRNVVACCAQAEKSRKATALLLDWVRLSEMGRAVKPSLSVFNTVVNVCEICDEQDLTLQVLDTMKKTHDTEGNIITFNIALKRLAKSHNYLACEGIVIGMLQAEVEPSVVTYTTAIAACAGKGDKNPAMAYEWLQRMRSRRVAPNAITYNTALSSCLDVEDSEREHAARLGSRMAADFLADAERQMSDEVQEEEDQYTNVIPDATSKFVARRLLDYLEEECSVDEEQICMDLQRLADFDAAEAMDRLQKKRAKAAAAAAEKDKLDEGVMAQTGQVEMELEYTTASTMHRTAEV